MPEFAFAGRDAVGVEVCGDSGEGFCTGRAGGAHMFFDGRGPRDGLGMIGGGEHRTVAAEFDAAGFGGGEGGFGALRDHLAFVFCEGGHDVQDQARGVGHIDGDKICGAFHEIGDEGDVAGQAVELGDEQGGFVLAAGVEGKRELGTVVFGAALDLDELGEDGALRLRRGFGGQAGCSMTVLAHAEELIDGIALCIQSQPGAALFVG